MNSKFAISLVLVCLLALAGCERVQNVFGLGKISPNPLRVIRQDPLAVPPSLELRPPLSVARTDLESGETLASQEGGTPASKGEAAILSAAAVHDVDPQIRQLLKRDRELRAAEEAEGSGGFLGFLDIFDVFDWFGEDDGEATVVATESSPPVEEADEEGGGGGGLFDWLDIFDWFGDDDE